MTATRQVWCCPKCGYRYESPAVIKAANCPLHPGRRVPMKLADIEHTRERAGRLAESNGPSGASTPPALIEPPKKEAARHG